MSALREVFHQVPESDWDFCSAEFAGIPYVLEVSKVENYEGVWEYRIHSPRRTDYHQRIDEIEFMQYSHELKTAFEAFNNRHRDELFARIQLNKVRLTFEKYWGAKLDD